MTEQIEIKWWGIYRADDPQGRFIRCFRDQQGREENHVRPPEALFPLDGPIDTGAWCVQGGERVLYVPSPEEVQEAALSAARRERDSRLSRSDWVELPSNRERKPEAFISAMDAWRTNARQAVTNVKAGLDPEWSDEPIED